MRQSLVVGATGIVGGYILQHLVRMGECPFALSRSPRECTAKQVWFQGEMSSLHSLKLPPFETLYCTANIGPLPKALRALHDTSLKRVVVFTSTSILTKIDSEIETERTMLRQLATAEQELIATCRELGIGWTILRPTLIYAEGRDANITRLARFISRYGFVPLAGSGIGLRQPVHAEDLAIGALAAAGSANAIDKIYSLPGTEVLPYREMVGRIFDGMKRPRRVFAVSPFLWRAAFAIAHPLLPNANAAMGMRMNKDMVFDAGPAVQDFGWNPRAFYPRFDLPL
ncbi:epimerase [Tardiphaga sp. P9-11]|uniref:SDR family oxidoreductase n=1 Tax=Tardiphaga sp. P9-11 TaxID=2024614 RepID=UPI0011F25E22|nr:epimerase [Tardiphaga sp. P9-11]KAA0073038.1 epimerase [Tardiphaga sp. P9-11]